MAVDLNKNKESLLAAWKEVTDDKNDTEWAVYGYEGTTNVLKVVEKGDGDWDEMSDELSSGKCMYSFCKVLDPNTNLPKYVLINWQPEGAPEQRKAMCARHTTDVARFFRGAHITINARSEDDVELEVVLKKVAAASGCQYSIHKEKAKPLPEAGPVGSVYKRTVAAREINIKKRDEFWEKTEKEEERRVEEERKRSVQERERSEKLRKEREAKEAAEREKAVKAKMQVINRQKSVEQDKERERKASLAEEWEKDQVEAMEEDEERRQRSESLRKQRTAEAASLVQKRGANPRAMFQTMAATTKPDLPRKAPPPPRKLKWEFQPTAEDQPRPVQKKGPIRLPTEEDEQSIPTRPEPVGQPEPVRQPEPVKQPEPVREPEPVRQPEPIRQPSPEPIREPSPEPVREPSPEMEPETRNLLRDGLPPRVVSDDEEEEEEQNWNEPEPDTTTPVAAQTPTEPETQNDQYNNYEQQQQDTNANTEKPKQIIIPPEAGLCCAALYDYQAEDETEISFDPGDIITNVEQIDAGWWMGVGPDSHQGMFPANYVEVINQ